MQILSSMFLESIYEKQTNNIFGFLLSSSPQGSETRKKKWFSGSLWNDKKEALVCAPVLFSEVAMKSQSTALFELSTLGLLTSVFILMN